MSDPRAPGGREPRVEEVAKEEGAALAGMARTIGKIAEGFSVTFRQTFRRDVTKKYPEEIPVLPPRSHIGRHRLNRHENGLEKCIGCELCAWACPADAIYVQGMDNDPDHPTSAGERAARTYQINYLRCIMCGLCVEACPTRALTLTSTFELSFESREEAIWTKEMLLAEPLPLGTAPGTEQGKSKMAFGPRPRRARHGRRPSGGGEVV